MEADSMSRYFEEKGGHSKKLFILLALLLVALSAMAICFYYLLEKQVTVIIDGKEQNFKTFASTLGEALSENGVILESNDAIDADLSAVLENTQTVNINRAFDIIIVADDKKHRVNSTELTVARALEKAGLFLGEEDKISLAPEELISASAEIEIIRVSTKYYLEKTQIEPSLQYRDDSTLEKGVNRIVSKGQSGLRGNTYKIIYENGVEVSREMTDTEILRQPKPKIIAQGTINVASRGDVSFKFSKAMDVTATAYTDTGHRTSTGVWPKLGTIAVDPTIIPYNTRLYVEGYGYGIAEDKGSAIKGNKIDVFLESEAACLQWGVKKVKLYVLE
jgi:uncharacterized protein YabE (DUF348 family)